MTQSALLGKQSEQVEHLWLSLLISYVCGLSYERICLFLSALISGEPLYYKVILAVVTTFSLGRPNFVKSSTKVLLCCLQHENM